MRERTREAVQLVLAAIVAVAWLGALATGRDPVVVTPPFMVVLAWAFHRPGAPEPAPGSAANGVSSSP